MKKLLTFILFMALVTPAMAAIQWRAGTGEAVLDGTSASNLIGYNSYNKVVQPLDNLLSTYCTESLSYNSVSIITVKAGSCVVSNSQGSIRMFMLDPTDTTLSATNLDTGSSFSAGTTYYVYATSPNATTQTSTYYISLSATNPTGQTYYKRLGNFTTNSSGNILVVKNDNDFYAEKIGDYTSKSSGVSYQALTDGFVVASCQMNGGAFSYGYTDATATPSAVVAECQPDFSSGLICTMTFPVKRGNYYKATCGSSTVAINFVPLSN